MIFLHAGHIIITTEPDTPLIVMRTKSGHLIFIGIFMENNTNLKPQQPALSVAEQIENLRKLNLIIDDYDYAYRILNDISYFRLIKAYSLGLKPKNSDYQNGVTFSQIVDLYKFNAKFRQLIFPLIERAEINLRCKISNYFSEKYDVLGYEDVNNFENPVYHQSFLDELSHEIGRNSKSPFVRNFRSNYVDGKLPMYAAIELFPFGMLSKFYRNMKPADKTDIAKSYGLDYIYLQSWIENIAYVRNLCAHYGRLYNARLTKTPRLYKQYRDENIPNNKVYATLICLKYLIPDLSHWITFVSDMQELLREFPNVDIGTMGFPKDWQFHLL